MNILKLTICLFLSLHLLASPAFSKTFEIMLQGFHFNSHRVDKGWYNIINENSQRIKDSGFTLVWFPPPSDSVSPLGYEPRQLEILDSAYGSKNQLEAAINALRPVRALADIVINHRSGTKNACEFTKPPWPQHTIVKDDESCDANLKSINNDTGEPANFARDLDHLNPTVIDGIIAWMNNVLKPVGFVGWRYDFVKGYTGTVIQEYNDNTIPQFTVGEYFDYNTQEVVNWIDSTHREPLKRATAFDFPLRNALYQAVAFKNYNFLKFHDISAGVIGVWSDKAVTFLENHDTEEARNSENAPPFPGPDEGLLGDQMIQGYAVILTHPGSPCIFWPDIYDSGSRREKQIRDLIQIRKQYCIHSESKIFIDTAQKDNVYSAYIQGDRGEVAVKIGPGPWNPVGEKWDPQGDLLMSGNDFAVWGEHGKLEIKPCQ